MSIPTAPAAEDERAQLKSWERALLVPPALVGLLLGIVLLVAPQSFATFAQFQSDDAYIFRLAGAAILGYGVALSVAVFLRQWRGVRLTVIGVAVNNVASLYACGAALVRGGPSFFVYVVMAVSLVLVAATAVLIVRHIGVPPLPADASGRPPKILFVVGAIAAGVFGFFPLFVPELFRTFNLAINAPFVVQEAGAASLGYAVIAILALQVNRRRELVLPLVGAATFNGAGGLVSIPNFLNTHIAPLPQLITPVGLAVLVACLLYLRTALAAPEAAAQEPA